MSCNIVFDFHSPHNNEYWFKCTHCGARDWFAYYDKPEQDRPIRSCNPSYVPKPPEPQDMTREQLLQEVARLRRYSNKLEQFQEQIYTIYPDTAVALQKNLEDETT